MPYIDSHGRPEILVHPDIVGGPASWRTEPANVEKDAQPPAPRRRRAAGRWPVAGGPPVSRAPATGPSDRRQGSCQDAVTASLNELVRRGVRDQLPEPPWRLGSYHRSTGPVVERDVDPDDGVTEGTLQATLGSERKETS